MADAADSKSADRKVVKVRLLSPAPSLIVTDNLPTTSQAIYQSDTGGCIRSGLNLTCNLGSIPTGTTKRFNILELVRGNRGQISNAASVAGSTTDLCPDSRSSRHRTQITNRAAIQLLRDMCAHLNDSGNVGVT